MRELIGEVSSSEDEEPDIEEGIDFTRSSRDNELLDYLAPEPKKKPALNQKTLRKLVVQKQKVAEKLPAKKEARKAAMVTANTITVPVTVHM